MLTPNKTAFNQRKNEANDFLKSVDSKIAAIVRDIENYQKAYVNAYNCEHSIGIEFTQKYINDYFTLVKYDIIDKEDKLVRVRQSCELQFKNDFLAKLKDSIEAAESQFQKLNKILKEVNYGNEKYKFDSNPSEDKSKLYEMIKADFNLGGNTLFSGDFEERYKDEIAYLFDKISTEESGNSKVLDEYSDYRNYLKYDIEITNENGKQFFSKICLEKSGGETQTPFYVIIAAAFCQIYSEQSIRLLMLDEAFDKMDDIRIQSMLKFFKVMKFQIILATPPAKMDVIAQFVESVFILKKIGASGVIYDIKHYLEE